MRKLRQFLSRSSSHVARRYDIFAINIASVMLGYVYGHREYLPAFVALTADLSPFLQPRNVVLCRH